VQDIMTPVVFSVPMNAPIAKIIHKILALEVRNLFVTDEVGVLVGSISVFDLLRALSEGEVLGVGKGESQWKTDY
jgi:predicted transcriptional regulator